MKIVVLYESFNTMSEGIQIVFLASVSSITDRCGRVSAVKDMEIIHMQRIGGDITGALMDGIVQNELLVSTDLGIISGVSCPFLVWSSFIRMKVASLSVFE